MKRLRDLVLEFDFGARSGSNRLVVFSLFMTYFFIGYMVKDTTRLFWVHWLSAYFIGALVFYFGHKHLKNKSPRKALMYLFPKDVWTSASTVNDCMVAVLNSFLARFLYAVFNILPLAAFTSLGYFLASFLPLEPSVEAPSFGIVFLFTLSTLLASDFSYYWAHRWAHQIPVWWEFHKVHHSAEVMTPITFLRYHPLDDVVYVVFRRLGQAVISGAFLYVYPSTLGVLTVLSSNAIVFVFDLLGSNLRHSHIWLSYGPKIERFLISPAMHHIHHSDNPKHFDKNFGAIFSVWDWMFGTIYIPKGKEDISFGIGADKEAERYDTVAKLYFNPFIFSYELFTKRGAKQAGETSKLES